MAAAAPAAKMKTKSARQPNTVCTAPPITGPMIGASPMIIAMIDNSRPARAPS